MKFLNYTNFLYLCKKIYYINSKLMKRKNIIQFVLILCGIVFAGIVSSKFFFRIDLTSEKRYTLSPETKRVLRQLDAPLYVHIYLDGQLPVQYRKLRNAIREMLDDFKAYSGNRLVYRFFDPSDAESAAERNEQYAALEANGIRRFIVHKTNKDGSQSQQIVFPGAILAYKERQSPVNLLSNNTMIPLEIQLNASFEALEYELIKTINLLIADSIGTIAFTTGQGEPGMAELYDLGTEFSNYYNVDFKEINGQLDALDPYKAVIITKPRKAFDEKDKFILDRYIMRGGKVMWLIDGANVNTDSLSTAGMTIALTSELNLDDQLFTYGVRINSCVIQDIVSTTIGVTTDHSSHQVVPAPWFYYPLAKPSPNHVITRNLGPVWLRYASDIDTVGRNSEIRKTVLLQTSEMSRIRGTPFLINLSEVQRMPEKQQFNSPHRNVAVLLEGNFPSLYRNRNARVLFPELQEKQAEKSVQTKMLVIADGDIAINDVRHTAKGLTPTFPLGYDRSTGETFANKDFLVNALIYLTDDNGLMNLRNREYKLRLLNKQKVVKELLKWQIINIVLPMILLVVGGLAYNRWRRYRYSV